VTLRPLIKGRIPLIKGSTWCPLSVDSPREPHARQSTHKGPRDSGAIFLVKRKTVNLPRSVAASSNARMAASGAFTPGAARIGNFNGRQRLGGRPPGGRGDLAPLGLNPRGGVCGSGLRDFFATAYSNQLPFMTHSPVAWQPWMENRPVWSMRAADLTPEPALG
jgi:hypothetical protein